MSRPLSSYMCSITPETAKVGSSYSHMRGPGIGCWFSNRSNCSHWSFKAAVLPINPNIYTDQWEPIVIYHSITLLVLIQLCSQRCWDLDSNYKREYRIWWRHVMETLPTLWAPRETTAHCWISLTIGLQRGTLMFPSYKPQPTVEETVRLPVIWYVST